MDNPGFMLEKLDIKILILFILRRISHAIAGTELMRLVTLDGNVNYFDYIECLDELIETGHVERNGESFCITKKGEDNGEAAESTLPYSIRAKAETAAAQTVDAMRRNELIATDHEESSDGTTVVRLKLSDGRGDVISLGLLVPDVETALQIEKRFREKAESLYMAIVELLSGGSYD